MSAGTVKPAVASMSARDLRLHLQDFHGRNCRGFLWSELVTEHRRQHELGATHEHETPPMPEDE